MQIGRALRGFRRLIAAPFSSARPAVRPRVHPRPRPEFPRVNARAGVVPIHPELSGLRIRRASIPRRAGRLLIQPVYRWRPSGEHRRRQVEIRLMNQWLKHDRRHLDQLPPILSYPEEADVLPTRLHPMLDPRLQDGPLRELPRDLAELEQPGSRPPRIIGPRVTGPDPEYLLAYRPLLPRQYREFLRTSPYPRLLACLVAVVTAIGSFLWISNLQQAEAVAAGKAQAARHAFELQIDAARAYGLGAANLRRLGARAAALRAAGPPTALIPSHARVRYFRDQARSYARLLRELRAMERAAFQRWRMAEIATYTSLTQAVTDVNGLGMSRPIPAVPACSTPACYRRAVAAQRVQASWLRETAGTLHRYGAQTGSSADPASTAGTELQEAHNLLALVPRAALPVDMDRLDSLYASATDGPHYARVGALAHLDRDTLAGALTRALPARAIVVSVESGTLTCYSHGRPVVTTAATAGSATPTGVFHVVEKQRSLSSLYWNRAGAYARYRYGSIPDWMPFSGDSALQAAPWRLTFGAGTLDAVGAYVPDTPGSVDLPPAAADRVFAWATTGTEVLLY